MRSALWLIVVTTFALVPGVPGCGTAAVPSDAGTVSSQDAAADASSPVADAGGDVEPAPTPRCITPNLDNPDAASCQIGRDCGPGHVCVVGIGVFCSVSVGFCAVDVCDGGLGSVSCASNYCPHPYPPAGGDPATGQVDCIVSGG